MKQTHIYKIIKENILYIVSFIVFTSLAVYFIPIQIQSYSDMRNELDQINEEIKGLEQRRAAIRSYDGVDLDSALLLLNTILPSVEDRFSVIPVIDNFEAITGMLIEQHGSPFEARPGSNVSINVQAVATEDQIRKMLENHTYQAGRLITIDSISIGKDRFTPELLTVGFTLQFHTMPVEAGTKTVTTFNQEAIDFVAEIQQYFASRGSQFSNVRIEEDDIPIDYRTRDNPFEK